MINGSMKRNIGIMSIIIENLEWWLIVALSSDRAHNQMDGNQAPQASFS